MNTCPNCGGNQFTETEQEWICQYCDTHHKKPEHLIQEGADSIPKPQPTPANEEVKPPKKKKKPLLKRAWFWILVILGIIGATSGGDVETQSPEESVPIQSVTETQADPYYHVGDIIDANGLQITYCAAEKWEESNIFLTPQENHMYIRLLLSVENTSQKDQYISSMDFTCYADDEKAEVFLIVTDALDGGTISPGRKDKGYIYFMVPEAAQEIEVEYEPVIWNNEKYVMKVEIE